MVLSALSFAQGEPFALSTVIPACLVILIACALLGIAFMISRVFAVPTWEAWVREEFANVLFAVFILVIFAGFAGAIEVTSSQLASNILSTTQGGSTAIWCYTDATGRWSTSKSCTCSPPCHFYLARGFLGSMYEKYGTQIKDISQYYATSVLLESFAVGGNFEVLLFGFLKIDVGFAVPTQATRAILNNSLGTIIDKFLSALTYLKLQEFILLYFAGLSGVLFAAGILFHILWFTRKLGGLLIAVAIGIYAIFPLIYILGWYTVDQSTVSMSLPQLTEEGWWQAFNPVQPDPQMLFTTYNEDGTVGTTGLFDDLSLIYVPSLAIPILAIFTTIGFIRHFSPMIGGDTEIAGLTRLI